MLCVAEAMDDSVSQFGLGGSGKVRDEGVYHISCGFQGCHFNLFRKEDQV